MDEDRWERKARKFERRMDRFGYRFGSKMDRWERRHHRNPGRHLFSGALFVIIGLVFLFGNMGLLDVDRILRFWPVILIAMGVFRLVEAPDGFAHSSGIFWVVVGSLFLLGSLGFLRMAFHQLWPIVLIGLGSMMLWRSAVSRREPRHFAREGAEGPEPPKDSTTKDSSTKEPWRSTTTSSNSVLSAMAILGSVEQRNNSQDFRGGSVTAVMGRCEIDLRSAAIAADREAVLEVFAMWGGIEVRVPPDWTVISQVDPIMGGYEDDTEKPKEETKRFIIRGPVIMGGIEVTN